MGEMKISLGEKRLLDDIDIETNKMIQPAPSTVTVPEQTSSKTHPNKTLKYVSLVLLMSQNALLILMMRYVRTRDGPMFKSSTAVIVAEFFKLIASAALIFHAEGMNFQRFFSHLHENIIRQPMDCLKVSVPSLVYVVQNNLLYIAVSNLDAATFQVSYQLKIMTTALFSVFMLNKQLSKPQWISLVILFGGVSLVQLQSSKAKDASGDQSQMIGMSAVLASCVMSGFAGVYFEKILKGTPQSVWLRNIQLAFLGVVIGFITMLIQDYEAVSKDGFLYGYDSIVLCVICIQAFGGLIVAVVVKYADNILKGFATSGAIILSCIASVIFFDFIVSLQFLIGASLVITSVYIYSKFPYVSPAAASERV